MKVSREGVILIKSFEGFRPRAVQRVDGRWVIGYGHTASAREGLSVSEADAELLLQYDLIPVVRTLNQQVEPDLNQHQFDALASFVFSIGVDRFVGSDLFAQLNAGRTTQAADALTAWADDSQAETPIRRRAAERALFIAAPGAPVALADLLAAPIPAPVVLGEPEAAPVLSGEDEVADEPDALANETPEPSAEIAAEPPIEAAPEMAPAAKPSLATSAAFNLYSPYRISAIGPLPGFPPPAAPVQANDDAVVESEPEPAIDPFPAVDSDLIAESPVQSEPVVEASAAEVITPVFPQASANFAPPMVRVETPTFTPAPALSVATEAAPVVFGEDGAPPLVLTPPEPTAASPFDRVAWPNADHAPQVDEPVLFDEAAVLEHLAIRSDTDALPPRRFDWSETGMFLVMGGIGLVSFGAAMAAFRRASEVEGGGDTALIGWVLAVIALACVSVSGFNLYQRFGRADRD